MPNKIYQIGETAITFDGTIGADVAWSIEGVANNAGRQSAHHNLGALSTARSHIFHYRFFTHFQLTPTLGNAIELHMKTSDGTHPDNDDGVVDTALSSLDALKNLKLINVLKVIDASANVAGVEMAISGIVEVYDRDVAFVIVNKSGATISATDSDSGLILTPLPAEIQDDPT